MVTLAQRFAELNQQPPDVPQIPNPPAVNRQAVSQDTFATPPTSPLPTMQSPRGRPPSTPTTAETPQAAATATEPVHDNSDDVMTGLVVPTCLGMYKKFNCTTRKMSTHMLARMIVHSGVAPQDVLFEWITPRVLRVCLAWPDWFQNAEQMAMFCLDDNGEMLHPPDHPLTMDTSSRNQDLVEEDNRVWDKGVLCFDQDMIVDDDPQFDLLNVTVNQVVVKVLQIFVQ